MAAWREVLDHSRRPLFLNGMVEINSLGDNTIISIVETSHGIGRFSVTGKSRVWISHRLTEVTSAIEVRSSLMKRRPQSSFRQYWIHFYERSSAYRRSHSTLNTLAPLLFEALFFLWPLSNATALA